MYTRLHLLQENITVVSFSDKRLKKTPTTKKSLSLLA